MTHALEARRPTSDIAVLGRLPVLPRWAAPRTRLARRLDRGTLGSITLVTGGPGWGKTLGVASWAVSTRLTDEVRWLSAADAAEDLDLFWDLVCECLVDDGARHLTRVPSVGSSASRRTHALATLGRSLARSGRRVLVLDDYPTGEVGALGRELGSVLEHSGHGLSLVVISRGQPAFPVQRHHVANDVTRITVPDLAMDWREVSEVLAGHEVEAHEVTARAVQRRTEGWGVGVRLAALALRDTGSVEAALREADRATVDFLTSEVLATSPPALRRLLVGTSMVEEVDGGLARAIGGPLAPTVMTRTAAAETLVEVHDDLSFRVPPLLRAAAAAELARAPLTARRATTRRAAQWYVDHDQVATGLQVGVAAEDWSWVARALVDVYVVPQILSGEVADDVASALAIPAVRAAEPLLDAAMRVRHGEPEVAEVVRRVLDHAPPTGREDIAGEVSAVCVRLALARVRGDVVNGLPLTSRLRQLIAQLPLERARELAAFLDAHVGALALWDGQLSRAEAALRRGARVAREGGGDSVVGLDCRAQLALLDALQGNLRSAELGAAAVLRHADPVAARVMAHAHLAAAWVHVERGEPVPARQHLDCAVKDTSDGFEPWGHTAHLLIEARLLVTTGQAEAALRLVRPALDAATGASNRWGVALLTLAAADALMAAGEPSAAHSLLAPGPPATAVMNAVMAARALVSLGDVRAVRKALSAVSPDAPGIPLDVQVEHWMLEARLAEEDGAVERTRLLVGRALRAAEREQLRRPLARESTWLVALIEQDATLRREHGGFLARLTVPAAGRSVRVGTPAVPAPMLIETLTPREAQVLGLLAEMYSTEEIARELFLSANTVKTYVRGILRKFEVNRRVDAVRRGHDLGLC